jgi:hypothetical protein
VLRGYEKGPGADAAQARIDALERGESLEPDRRAADRRAVYGSTDDEPEQHFLGWADEVDVEDLFASGRAWGITVRRRPSRSGK